MALRNQVIAITEITGAIVTADLVQIVDHALQDRKVKTEVLDRSADQDRKDKTEDHVLRVQKARTAGLDQSVDRDRKDKTVDLVHHVQKARTVGRDRSADQDQSADQDRKVRTEDRDQKGKTVQKDLLL